MQKGTLLNWWEAITPIGKALLIALAAPLLVLNAWAVLTIADYFHSLVVILVGASLLAFLLNYPVSFMEQHGTQRQRAAVLVFLLALATLFALGITLIPIAFQQAQQLVTRLPEWFDSGRQQLLLLDQRLETSGIPFSLDALEGQIYDRLKFQFQVIAGQVLNVAVFTVTSLLDFLLTMVLAFYLLQHGDDLWHSLIEWLPTRFRRPLSETLRESFQNYFLAQFITGTCMGVALTLLFVWLRVPFGLLFGLTIGTMALVPFGGTVGIIVVTLLVALRDISLGLKVLAGCLVVQQILENLIAPRILGQVTGLNPVWVLISILTGARIGGLLGVIVAVPSAVVIKNALEAVRTSDVGRNLVLRSSTEPLTPETQPALESSLPGDSGEAHRPALSREDEITPKEPPSVAGIAGSDRS